MALFETIEKDYTQARRDKDEFKKVVLNLLVSDLRYIKVNERVDEVPDAKVIACIQKSVKQKEESLAAAESSGRTETAAELAREIELLSSYLPEALDEAQLLNIAREVKTAIGATGPQDMGHMMKEVMARVAGQADGGVVKNAVMSVLKEA